MATVSFTHRIYNDLKAELDKIAQYDDRSSAYVANQAIQDLVEDRQATRELIETGLSLIEKGAPTIPAEDIHSWLLSE